jgi:predicted nucleic acid-binding protein
MKYVLDSSVAVKFVLPEPDSGKAIRLLDEYSKALHELIAPDLFSTEVANALVSAERSARIKKGECASLLYDVMSNAPVFYPANPLLVRSMEMAIDTRQGIYDCIYLALAEAEHCELLTADDVFARRVRSSYPFIVSLKDL